MLHNLDIRNTSPLKFLVMGSPIEHSISPIIHQKFAQQFNIQQTYEKLYIDNNDVIKAISEFGKSGGTGANITAPLKNKVFMQLDKISDRARHSQAVNTIAYLQDGSIFGDNTDGIGLTRDLAWNDIKILGKVIVILGAGGATQGILRPLLSLSPKKIIICNRDQEKSREIVNYFKTWGKIQATTYNKLNMNKADIVINATSCGINDEIPPLKQQRINCICYDLNYADAAKPFLNWAKKNGALKSISGLGMLVEQAAEAFCIWHNKRPETAKVKAELALEQF